MTTWSSSATRCARRSANTACSRATSVCWWPCRAARTRSRCGTSSSTTATTRPASIWTSASSTIRWSRRRSARRSRRGARLLVSRVADEVGGPVPVIKQVTRRPPCSGCGLSKRYLMNRVALDHGLPVVATGHNLDDEAATLFGSVMHWRTEALPRQSPALASTHPKLVRRVKPLYRLSERETAAYAFLRRIDYIVEECPFAAGATSIAHKEVLNRMDDASPGAKHNFLFGFLDKARAAFERLEDVTLLECVRCGQVTTSTVCAFCKLADQVKRAAGAGPPAPDR